MQDITFSSSAQTSLSAEGVPSLALLKEGLQVRLERATFSAHATLELFQQSGRDFTPINTEAIIDHLELTMLELRYLANELLWLRWIREHQQNN